MADSFINATGLQAIKTWIEGKFATDTDLDALSDRVDEIVAEGGEPNVIEEVQVNGVALPISGKAVDVTVPTATSELTNDGDGDSAFATESYVGTHGGKIDVIKVNGQAQSITEKTVDIAVPTKVSDLENDEGYQTADDVTALIDEAVSSAFTYKGSVATVADLPTTGNKVGDVYDVVETGTNYAWDGEQWDALGSTIDMTAYWTSTPDEPNTLVAMTVSEINAILNA